MKGQLIYKGYVGSVEIDYEGNCLHGRILHINDVVSYGADAPKDLVAAFRSAVDDYLETCKKVGKEPQRSYSGNFNVRVPPELHRKSAMLAKVKGIALNEFVKDALEEKVKRSEAADAIDLGGIETAC